MTLSYLPYNCSFANPNYSYHGFSVGASEKQALLLNNKHHQFSNTEPLAQQPTVSAALTISSITAETQTIAYCAVDDLLCGDSAALVALDDRIRGKNYADASWAETIARHVLERLPEAIKPGSILGEVLSEAYKKARSVPMQMFDFAQDHPVLTIVIALGALCLLSPSVMNILGFTARGVAAGSWAALWQSAYGGFVKAGSLFSYLQHLGALYG